MWAFLQEKVEATGGDLVSTICACHMQGLQKGVCSPRSGGICLYEDSSRPTTIKEICEYLQNGHLNVDPTEHHDEVVFTSSTVFAWLEQTGADPQ